MHCALAKTCLPSLSSATKSSESSVSPRPALPKSPSTESLSFCSCVIQTFFVKRETLSEKSVRCQYSFS